MRRALITAVAAAVLTSFAGAMVYDTYEKTALAPVIAADDAGIYLAWARLDGMMKFARFELSDRRGGEAYAQASQALTSRTNEYFAMVLGDGAVFLAFIDYRTGKAELLRYELQGKDNFKRTDSRSTQVRARGGVSLAYADGRLYLGYTDAEDDFVNVVSYKVSHSGKLSRENERKLAECETVVGSAITLEGGKLAVAWVDSDKKFMLTTYGLDISSKGPSYRHLKNTRTEIRMTTETNITEKPALASSAGEVYLAYIDRNDKTAHVNFYLVDDDGSMRSAGETRVNERPVQPVGVGAFGEKVYVAVVDTNKRLLIGE